MHDLVMAMKSLTLEGFLILTIEDVIRLLNVVNGLYNFLNCIVLCHDMFTLN
jgi:hypothetical protein